MTTMDPVAQILAIFTALSTWLTSTIDSVQGIFWSSESGLTFVGSLSAVAVAIGVTLLVANYIKSFIKLR